MKKRVNTFKINYPDSCIDYMSYKPMAEVPTTVPVSRLRLHQNDVLDRLQDEKYILLIRHGRPVAVLVDIHYWNQMAERYKQLKTSELVKEWVYL